MNICQQLESEFSRAFRLDDRLQPIGSLELAHWGATVASTARGGRLIDSAVLPIGLIKLLWPRASSPGNSSHEELEAAGIDGAQLGDCKTGRL